ncbi:hypothetical protein ACTZGI_23515 [Rahnella aceris]|uniref:pPIWI-associating nuclease domain-containing protein n=1 Tax=Rahnella sp. (strain Y9602) TaxID=2703885 RepID=UPI003FD563BB
MRQNQSLNIITAHLETDFEKELFQAAIYNLDDEENKLRFSNYAYAFRELFNHVLKRMAPDACVENCDWFEGRDKQTNKIPRRQCYKFIVQGGLTDGYVKEELKYEYDSVYSGLSKAFNSLNKLTHVQEGVFSITKEEGYELIENVENYVASLFVILAECHQKLIDHLFEHINDAAIHSCLCETIQSVDELSSHSSIEEIYVDDVSVTSIWDEEITFLCTGTVDVGLQFGSNSDIRRGDGAVLDLNFPFTCEVRSSVFSPEELYYDEGSFCVDNSSWTDNYYGHGDEF